MRIPALSLATQTAIIIAAMLLLSVGLAYLGVNWYSSYIEESLLQTLPSSAANAYRDINAGILPDTAGLKELFEYLNKLTEPLDWNLYVSVLLSGFLSALICSAIGIYLARKIAQPLKELTVFAQALKSGDFSVRMTSSPKSTIEVASLIDSFNALATSLQDMEKRLQFNNMAVAHELRTPLTILRGTMQGMVDGIFPLEKKTLGNLLLQAEGLSRIVEDLRTLSLAIGQKLVVHTERIELSELTDGVLHSAKPMFDSSHIEVETALQEVFVSGDSQRIRQAVLALLENACRYAQKGANLRCEIDKLDDGLVAIRILDRGPGFPKNMCGVEVKPFWRGEGSRSRATGGTGLGLSVVQAIAIAHGGALELQNRPGGGASVSIILPGWRP